MQTNGSESSTSSQQQHKHEQNQRPQLLPWTPSMHYPAGAMIMQRQMMPPHYAPPPLPPLQHYVAATAAYHHYPQPHPAAHAQYAPHGPTGGENKTIWIGDLHHWMDENYLHNCFVSTNEINSVKVIRNKHTGLSEGYGFVEFFTHSTAEKVLQNYSVMLMPNTDQPFRLNWATFSTGDKRSENAPDLSIFVGDLAADVTDTILHETFSSKYPSVKAAKVVIDVNTGRSKGYGFVRFGDEAERSQAMTEMNGVYCSTRPMRIGAATPRKSSAYQQGGNASNGTSSNGSQSDTDSNNTTIFVGGLDPSVTDEDLKQPFSQYGEIISVKIPVGKGCGFVQFANRSNAEEALQKLNGSTVGKQTVRLSWGRNPSNRQAFRPEYGNQWTGAYYGAHIYEGYGYPLPPTQDATMHAAAAAYYPIFGSHQQQVN